MPQHEQVELLLTEAAQDEYVLDNAPVEIFGFHAQQVAEKLLKAVLVAAGTTYPKTHQLAELIDLVSDCGVEFPEAFESVRYLTPFAVEFRYDVVPEEPEEPLDKPQTRQLLKDLRLWEEAFMRTNLKEDEDEEEEDGEDEEGDKVT